MADDRTRLSQDVEHELKEHFTDLVLETVVPRSVRLAEAPSFGDPGDRARSRVARGRRLPGARGGGAGAWLGSAGMGRGLAAILPESHEVARAVATATSRWS